MKPYGQKQQKSKFRYKCGHPKCIICTTAGWDVFKSRERGEVDYEDESLEFYDDYLDGMIVVEPYGDDFKAISNYLNFEVLGVTPEHALGKVWRTYEETVKDEKHIN